MGLKSRSEILWRFIEENLEIGFGYLPEFEMGDANEVDTYIQKIKDDVNSMIENGWIKEDSIEELIYILKKLDEI